MSWWDYGYQIAGMANRTTLVDNNTWNNSHIALVGKAMSSNESAAYEVCYFLPHLTASVICNITFCVGNESIGCRLRLGHLWRCDRL
jgi:hypothetical protein